MNACTHNAEPSPQVWLGNENDHWQETILHYNIDYYTEIIIIILI